MAYSDSFRTPGITLPPSANVPSEVVDAGACIVLLMSDCAQSHRFRILGTVHIPSGLVSDVCLLPAHNQARGNHPFTVLLADHVRLRGIYHRHSLELEHPLPFGFDRFQKLRSVLGRKGGPRHLVGVPWTEVKLSMQRTRLGRRNRKDSVSLAFPGVQTSSLSSLAFWTFIVLSPIMLSYSRLPVGLSLAAAALNWGNSDELAHSMSVPAEVASGSV